jgi:hypothetical protein
MRDTIAPPHGDSVMKSRILSALAMMLLAAALLSLEPVQLSQ